MERRRSSDDDDQSIDIGATRLRAVLCVLKWRFAYEGSNFLSAKGLAKEGEKRRMESGGARDWKLYFHGLLSLENWTQYAPKCSKLTFASFRGRPMTFYRKAVKMEAQSWRSQDYILAESWSSLCQSDAEDSRHSPRLCLSFWLFR